MNIIWDPASLLAALAGGVLIGLAAAWMALGLGRIAGISGLLGGLVDGAPDRAMRVAFVGGLLLAPALYLLLRGELPAVRMMADTPQLLLAGLLVGIGTRFASGCTSGHGVCGLSRLSPRSLVATLSFMGAGFAAVYLLRHLLA
ncbi:YeeE/YedE thiosulfate transporter family protein [Vogesella sp. LYT5W]|uniref:YeeE/YedE thiosulfate transporter family protein n=1 Tax=Vogesella margarita TaxID=2984199 RepID=A0ABT5ISN3_9NEIS|nr:YeeE/YedE thiosulfate transporter family protein [Vogesella margarita]MDC7715310.1 YeeE/YedE thiosulfate transporter family protein [Vogesella margarita]